MDEERVTVVRVMDQDQNEIDEIKIENSNNVMKTLNSCNTVTNASPASTYSFYFQPSIASSFLNLLLTNPCYRQSFLQFWSSHSQSTLLSIHLTSTPTMHLDYAGAGMAQAVILEMIEMEDALHWLSTLGGAFSNLGEHSPQFALRAGDNAMKQLLVAMRSGDKTVVVKCWLFLGQSLLQQGQFRDSATILRRAWRECHIPPLALLNSTAKLLNMCRGIWARLKYEREKVKDESMGEKFLEVEQKFCVPVGYKAILESAGARKVAEKTLSDLYLDTQDMTLMRQDVWLRKRGRDWELKIPVGVGRDNSGGMTEYKEVEGKEEVEREVAKFTGVGLSNMVELVKLGTVRECWSLEEFSIVIDKMDEDGWTVGEVELLVKNNEDLEMARKKVQDVVTLLGFTVQKYGKVERCIRAQNVEAAKILDHLERKRVAGFQKQLCTVST